MKTPKRFYGYLKKDFLLLYKRKKYLYLFILLPLIIGILFLSVLNPGSYNIKLGICDFDNSDISKQAFDNLNGFKPIILEKENCLDNLLEQIKLGELDLGLEIGQGFAKNIQDLKQSKLVIYYDNTDVAFTNLISWKVDQSLEPFKQQIIDQLNKELGDRASSARTGLDIILEINALPRSLKNKAKQVDSDLQKVEELTTEFLVNPVWTDKRPIHDAMFKKDAGIAFIFPIIALFITLMLASTAIIYDKQTNFITRIKASSGIFSYLLAKTLFFTILVLVQFLIIFILFLLYGATYQFDMVNILELVLFIGIINTLIGFLIGLIAKSEGIAVLFSLIISFPLMLISGIFFPLQALPAITQFIAKILPLHFQISATKTVLLFGQNFSNIWIFFAIGLFLVTWWFLRKD